MTSPNVNYQSSFIGYEESLQMFDSLLKCPFERPAIKVHGRTYNPLRMTCSYADPDIFYSYSGSMDRPMPWTQELLDIKTRVEAVVGCEYNYVLVNYYKSGHAQIGVHKDNESCLDKVVPIATVSFGAVRTLVFSRKGSKSVSYPLESGSLLLMMDQEWCHSIPPQHDITEGRISLTFRRITPFVTTVPAPVSPMKRALDEWDSEYHISPTEKPRKRNRRDLLHQACAPLWTVVTSHTPRRPIRNAAPGVSCQSGHAIYPRGEELQTHPRGC